MSDYAGKNVLITGAASGIGRLLAQKIAAEGARVILWDVESAALERTRAELAAAGRTVATYTCNLRDRAAIAATATATLRDGGPVDVLINNAGVVSG